MRITRRGVLAAGMVVVALAVTGPAGAVGDAHERADVSGRDAVAFFYANERETMRGDGQAAIDAFRRNELATISDTQGARLVHYVDAASRGEHGSNSGSASVLSTTSDAFDWGAAAIGASSALAIAVLLGATLLAMRHTRGRPLAR